MASAAQGLQATPPTANGFKPQLPRRSYASRWTPQPNTSTSASTTRMSSRRFGQRERGEKGRRAQRSSNNNRARAGPVQAILH